MLGLAEAIDRKSLAAKVTAGEAAEQRAAEIRAELSRKIGHRAIGGELLSHLVCSGDELAIELQRQSNIIHAGMRAANQLRDNPTERIANRERELYAMIREADETMTRARAELDRLAAEKLNG